jgi:hypothetical protein
MNTNKNKLLIWGAVGITLLIATAINSFGELLAYAVLLAIYALSIAVARKFYNDNRWTLAQIGKSLLDNLGYGVRHGWPLIGFSVVFNLVYHTITEALVNAINPPEWVAVILSLIGNLMLLLHFFIMLYLLAIRASIGKGIRVTNMGRGIL